VVIVVERTEEGRELPVQCLVYYLSEVLTLSKQNYPHYQKVVYGVYMAARKLKNYFEEHPITVVSTTPLSEIIGYKDATGRVAKWVIELAAHTIQYKPRTTIKSQIIADFFADWGEHQYLPLAPDSTYWRMNFDGSKMLGGLGANIVFTSPKGDKLQYVLQIDFCTSNNVTEYEALVHGLKLAKEIGIRRILYFKDSDLVVHQVSGEWDAKDANMDSYRFYMQQLCGFFEGYEFHHVPRANNGEADQLSKIGSTKQDILDGVSLEIIRKPSIKPSPKSGSVFMPEDPAPDQMSPLDSGAAISELKEAASQPEAAGLTKDLGAIIFGLGPHTWPTRQSRHVIGPRGYRSPGRQRLPHPEIPSWAEPFSNYLITGDLPKDEVEARQLQCRTQAYTIINSELYKRIMSGIFQKCIEPKEGLELLKEIHQGECGHHASSRALVAKAFRHGFYWPTALRDADQLVKHGNGCQCFSKHRNTPAAALKTIPLTWPFAVWGLDMVGPFKTAPGGLTHLLVAVDKFIKWIEASQSKNSMAHPPSSSSTRSSQDMESPTASSLTMGQTSQRESP
jgi:ribonuclease HI